MTLLDWVSIASAVFAGVSALVAAAAIYIPARIQASQRTLAQAQLSLERAYDALSKGGNEENPPAPDRLNWLTAGRHIVNYKRLKAGITEAVHKTICEEQEEYWRHRFYICLSSGELLQPWYYMERLAPNPKEAIDKRSALVVHAFAKWPEGRPDPLDAVDVDKLIEESRALDGNPGLRAYLEKTFEMPAK
jgi:hypothetical protein